MIVSVTILFICRISVPFKQVGIPKPKVFNATQGSLSGTVDLQCPFVVGHAAYIWEMIADPINANTWQQIKVTNTTSYTMSGLTPSNKFDFLIVALSNA